ncbi:MAG TPA: hypothetical protein VHV75_15205 [Solirubrobacteraceae bacterium]|nr:hypothetical protein [Solirubrobacteraceae bacterium]
MIYLFLALVMVAGLVLVGVGTGSNQGGLLNAFTNNGSGGGQGQVIDQQTANALKATKKHPNSASAWSSLVLARYSAAGIGSNFNSTTGAYSAGGKKQLQDAADAWLQYLKVSNDKPSFETSVLAARVYQNIAQWANESNAWEYAVQTQPAGSATSLKPYLCLSLSSYAAKRTSQGDLAAAKAVKLTPKLQRLTLQSTLKSAKSSTTTAQETLAEEC